MFTTDEGEVIRAADQAASVIEGRGKSEYVGLSKVISVRVPVILAAQVQALAHKSAKTRNSTVTTLLEVGLEEVRERLSEETLKDLVEIEQELLADEFNAMKGA
ncbi:hypothetical protein [Acidovorax sp. K2F]|uniref:hypothetical protein n=1 Tax=Acidovorax sp. K2F TaxID=2978125 RepID=UPI0021B0B446|nr:hypothetical protein [Acidovorax sp. K2F]MCT6721775.1 hypothetical protein [Acidovorax sp. K2F]